MRIIPAIDLKDGQCVRLLKGNFDAVTTYSTNPVEIGKRYSSLQVDDLHIVDLDGARSGTQSNRDIVREIVTQTGLSVQLGGGIRDRDDVLRWLSTGVQRCVIGSIAVNDPDRVKNWLAEFGADSIVLALDVNVMDDDRPVLTTHGWSEDSGILLWDCIDGYQNAGIRHVLCTDVGRDGAMTGPNLDLYKEFLRRYPALQLQASGGVRHVSDLNDLEALGVPGTITGRALLDGKISAAQVASFRRNA